MNKIVFLLSIACFFSCKSTAPSVSKNTNRFTIIKKDEADEVKKSRAYAVGRRLLSTCNTSKFTPFTTSEATEKVIAKATIEKISETCKKINFRNGKFIDLKLIEVSKDKDTDDLIFKYDIDYEKKLYKREIRITVNTENQVSEIITKEITKIF
jgi:hypothetical protein